MNPINTEERQSPYEATVHFSDRSGDDWSRRFPQEEQFEQFRRVSEPLKQQHLSHMATPFFWRSLLEAEIPPRSQMLQAFSVSTNSGRPTHLPVMLDSERAFVTVTEASSVDASQALEDLAHIDEEVEEKELPEIAELAKENARSIILELSRRIDLTPVVYATDDGEVAILFQKLEAKSGVLILCDNDGGGACFSNISSKKTRARYDDISTLPDAFVIGELLKLRAA